MIFFLFAFVFAQEFATGSSFSFASSTVLSAAKNEKLRFDASSNAGKMVDYSAYSRPRNQGNCGSCWLWSALAVVENHNNRLREWASKQGGGAKPYEYRPIDIESAASCLQLLLERDQAQSAAGGRHGWRKRIYLVQFELTIIVNSWRASLMRNASWDVRWPITPDEKPYNRFELARTLLATALPLALGFDVDVSACTYGPIDGGVKVTRPGEQRRTTATCTVEVAGDGQDSLVTKLDRGVRAINEATTPLRTTYEGVFTRARGHTYEEVAAANDRLSYSLVIAAPADGTFARSICAGSFHSVPIDVFARQQQLARFVSASDAVTLQTMTAGTREFWRDDKPSEQVDFERKCTPTLAAPLDPEMALFYSVDPFNSGLSKVWSYDVKDANAEAAWGASELFHGQAPIYSPMLVEDYGANEVDFDLNLMIYGTVLSMKQSPAPAIERYFASLMNALDYGALVVGIKTCPEFMSLRNHTIFTGGYTCNRLLGPSSTHGWHAIALVGYKYTGSYDTSYFIIQNSWKGWGDNGFARIKFGTCVLHVALMPLLRPNPQWAQRYGVPSVPFYSPLLPRPRDVDSFALPLADFSACRFGSASMAPPTTPGVLYACEHGLSDDVALQQRARQWLASAAADAADAAFFVPSLMRIAVDRRVPAVAVDAVLLQLTAASVTSGAAGDLHVRAWVSVGARGALDAPSPAGVTDAAFLAGGAAVSLQAGYSGVHRVPIHPDATAVPASRWQSLTLELRRRAPTSSAPMSTATRAPPPPPPACTPYGGARGSCVARAACIGAGAWLAAADGVTGCGGGGDVGCCALERVACVAHDDKFGHCTTESQCASPLLAASSDVVGCQALPWAVRCCVDDVAANGTRKRSSGASDDGEFVSVTRVALHVDDAASLPYRAGGASDGASSGAFSSTLLVLVIAAVGLLCMIACLVSIVFVAILYRRRGARHRASSPLGASLARSSLRVSLADSRAIARSHTAAVRRGDSRNASRHASRRALRAAANHAPNPLMPQSPGFACHCGKVYPTAQDLSTHMLLRHN